MQAIQDKKDYSMASNPAKENIFVYKIIHDLRNPIELQKNQLENLLKDGQRILQIFTKQFTSDEFKYRPERYLKSQLELGHKLFIKHEVVANSNREGVERR